MPWYCTWRRLFLCEGTWRYKDKQVNQHGNNDFVSSWQKLFNFLSHHFTCSLSTFKSHVASSFLVCYNLSSFQNVEFFPPALFLWVPHHCIFLGFWHYDSIITSCKDNNKVKFKLYPWENGYQKSIEPFMHSSVSHFKISLFSILTLFHHHRSNAENYAIHWH